MPIYCTECVQQVVTRFYCSTCDKSRNSSFGGTSRDDKCVHIDDCKLNCKLNCQFQKESMTSIPTILLDRFLQLTDCKSIEEAMTKLIDNRIIQV